MRGRLVAVGENAGAFQRDVDLQYLPRQLGRIALGGHLDPAAADIDGVVPGLHLAVETAMHAVIAEQMRIGLDRARSEEHTSELQSLMRISYAVFCWKKKKKK